MIIIERLKIRINLIYKIDKIDKVDKVKEKSNIFGFY